MSSIHNPWRASLENCITGENWLRASEYRAIIAELDALYAQRAELLAALERARRCLAWACEQRPEFVAEYEAADAAIAKARGES